MKQFQRLIPGGPRRGLVLHSDQLDGEDPHGRSTMLLHLADGLVCEAKPDDCTEVVDGIAPAWAKVQGRQISMRKLVGTASASASGRRQSMREASKRRESH